MNIIRAVLVAHLGIVSLHEFTDELRVALLLDCSPDLGGQPLRVGNVVQADEAGGKRERRLLCQVVQERPAVIAACAAGAILVQRPAFIASVL